MVRDDFDKLSLLVIAYLRPDNLFRILSLAQMAGIKDYFISIDYPSIQTPEIMEQHSKVLDVARKFQSNQLLNVSIFVRNQNVGCSAAVLSSCDWFFGEVNQGIILEDDCVPTLDFFEYCRDAMESLIINDQIWMACGTQLAPLTEGSSWIVSKYALTWGWATTSSKWREISSELRNGFAPIKSRNMSGISRRESVYWNAGARRAMSGYSDAWDTPLVQKMLLKRKFSILPSASLVTNIGNDMYATHTHGNSMGLGITTGSYDKNLNTLERNILCEQYLFSNFYKIRSRHLLSTQVTRLLDFISTKSRKSIPLLDRWEMARIYNL